MNCKHLVSTFLKWSLLYTLQWREHSGPMPKCCVTMATALISYTHTEKQRQKAFDRTSCGFIPSTQSILETFPSRERERHLCFSLIHHLEIYLSNPCYGLIREAPSFFTICLTSPMNLHTHSRALYGVIEHKDIFVVLSDMYITK